MPVTAVGSPANTYPTPAVTAPATSATSQLSGETADAGALNQSFDQFLLLLTTQLKNQDPLSPMDSTEFTNQLVSFSGVEQQIKTNAALAKLVANASNTQTSVALGYIGLNVDVNGKQFDYNGSGSVKTIYNLPSDASINTISIQDQNGNSVFTTTGELSSGSHTFMWDGLDSNGQQVPAGTYTLQVGALDAAQKILSVKTTVPGFVTGIETAADGNINLIIGTHTPQSIPLSGVTQATL